MTKKHTRNCPECGDILFYSSYISWWHCKNDNGRCVKCSNKYKNNKLGKLNKSWKGYEDIPSTYFSNVKINAKKRKLEFNISIKDLWILFLKQGKKCIYTNLPLSFSTTRRRKDGTASLDRIDSSKGYVEGNVQWVHKDVNWMKQDFDQTHFVNLCDMISNNIIRVVNETPIDTFLKNERRVTV